MRGLAVGLVENSPLFRTTMVLVLNRLRFSVTTADPYGLPNETSKKLDIILVDVVTLASGLAELEEITKRCSRVAPVLLLTREDRIEQIVTGLRAGARGFVKQTASLRELRNAITAVGQGKTYFEPELFQKIIGNMRVLRLTKREEEVLRYLSLGQTNKEIGQRLNLTEQSIKTHVSNLLRKTGVTNRSSLARYAIMSGLAMGE